MIRHTIMLKHKKLIIILLSIIFLITALTIYANKYLFPTLVKKIAIEQAENFLHRKVEIESIRFNWVKGLIVDKAIVYQKDAPDQVFVQFNRLSMGLIFIPGAKEHTISIPFVTIEQPSAHLIRTTETTWNFSDLLTPPPSDGKPSPFKVTVGGINVVGGQVRLDDKARSPEFNELFDDINLSLSLAYKGIGFDFKTIMPKSNGVLSAKGSYSPLDGSLQAKVLIKNINTAAYMNLVAVKDLRITSGQIDLIDADIDYSKEKITFKGNVDISNVDAGYLEYQIKTTLNASNVDATYSNGPIVAHGDIQLTTLNFTMPQLSVQAPSGIIAHINDANVSGNDLTFDGNLKAKSLAIQSGTDKSFKGDINLENIKARRDKDGIQVVGGILVNNAAVTMATMNVSTAALSVKPMTVTIDPSNTITVVSDIKADKFLFKQPPQEFSGNVSMNDLNAKIHQDGSMSLTGKLAVDDYAVAIDQVVDAKGSLNAHKLMVKFGQDIVKVSTELEVSRGKVTLPGDKVIEVSPQLEIEATVPLKTPAQATYKGSITFSDAKVSGYPYTPLDGIGLDADFTDQAATINALTVNILDTSFRASGTVSQYQSPLIDINAEANEANLALVKNYLPQLFEEQQLDVSGTASFKIKFKGSMQDPLAGEIQALATLANVNVVAGKANQSVKNVSGIVEATPNSLIWREFKGTYLDKAYVLTGQLNDFKNPKVTTTLDGADVQLKADIAKEGDIVTINQLKGKYLTIAFDTTGTVNVANQQQPILDITANSQFLIEDIVKLLPAEQQKPLEPIKPTGAIALTSTVKGPAMDWKNLITNATITSPLLSVAGYKINTLKLVVAQADGKINNFTVDANVYDGTVHGVGSSDLKVETLPFELALNIDAIDIKKLKMDSPLSAENVSGKFYLTSMFNGNLMDIINLKGKGSLAIREGFLAEFNVFKGLLGVLNEALRVGDVMITDVEGNFVIENQKISTESLRLKSSSLVMLTQGWIGFDQMCDLKVTIDLSSSYVPTIAEDVLRSLEVTIYDKISAPKFKKKISVPQVINTLFNVLPSLIK